MVIEAKYSVGPPGTYKEEEVVLSVDGGIFDYFSNITNPFFDYKENSYTFFITLDNVTKFEEFKLDFRWQQDNPSDVVTIDYVKVYSKEYDYSFDCILPGENNTCILCNKFKGLSRDFETGVCLPNPEGKFLNSETFDGSKYGFADCSTDNSVKTCWSSNSGAIECYEGFVLINGECLLCSSECGTCKQAGTLPDDIYNCASCPPGMGLKNSIQMGQTSVFLVNLLIV